MQGWKRKVVYVGLYELIAIVCATVGLAGMSGHGLQDAGMLATGASALAVLWNLVYNSLFEAWERRQAVAGRSLLRRICHAVGFEAGLVAALVPLMAWWFGISLWQALLLDLGLVVFFIGYTFVFNWVFDAIFGLPDAALGAV